MGKSNKDNDKKRILVLADTHIPRVARDLPAEIYDEIKNVDMIIHAGDFVEKDLLDKLEGLKETKAVYGNMDSPFLQRLLSLKQIIQIGKFRIGIVHGHGAPQDIVETVTKEFKGVDAIIFGHSHSALNMVKDGILFFNPGSPTDIVFASSNSYGILEADDERIEGRIITL